MGSPLSLLLARPQEMKENILLLLCPPRYIYKGLLCVCTALRVAFFLLSSSSLFFSFLLFCSPLPRCDAAAEITQLRRCRRLPTRLLLIDLSIDSRQRERERDERVADIAPALPLSRSIDLSLSLSLSVQPQSIRTAKKTKKKSERERGALGPTPPTKEKEISGVVLFSSSSSFFVWISTLFCTLSFLSLRNTFRYCCMLPPPRYFFFRDSFVKKTNARMLDEITCNLISILEMMSATNSRCFA